MLSYFNSPFGMIDTYDLCIRLGLVFGVIAQAIYLCKKKGISKFFLLLVSYYGVMIIGSFAAKVMRGINDGLLDGRLSFGVFKNTMSGSHFLGYIIVFAFLYFPAMIFVKQFFVEVFGIEICDSDEYLWIGEH